MPEEEQSRRDFLRLLAVVPMATIGAVLTRYSGVIAAAMMGENSKKQKNDERVFDIYTYCQENLNSRDLLRLIYDYSIERFGYDDDARKEWLNPDIDFENLEQQEFKGNCKDFAILLSSLLTHLKCEDRYDFSKGFLITITKDDQDEWSAHAGLLVLCRDDNKWFLLDNRVYEFDNQKGFIEFEGEQAPYQSFNQLTMNGVVISEAYLSGGGLAALSDDSLAKVREAAYWNKVYPSTD